MPFFSFPLPIVPCDAATTCNGHGSCSNDGHCQCDDGFYAANCSGKLFLNCRSSKYFLKFKIHTFLFIKIVECDAAKNCSSKGICGPDGACECDVGLYMDDCSSKL